MMSFDISYVPFVTGGWNGQIGQRVALKDTMERPLVSHSVPWGLRDEMNRFVLKDTMECPLMYHSVPSWTDEMDLCDVYNNGKFLIESCAHVHVQLCVCVCLYRGDQCYWTTATNCSC